MTAPDLITLGQAAAIYRRLTGDSPFGPRVVRDYADMYPHLGVWQVLDGACRLAGIHRHRWEYFIKIRLAMGGPHNIFNPAGRE